jgi:hypothetical protein
MNYRYLRYILLFAVCAGAGWAIFHGLCPDATLTLGYPVFAAEPGASHAIPSFKPTGFEGQIRALYIGVSACLLVALVMLWRCQHGGHCYWHKTPRHPYHH